MSETKGRSRRVGEGHLIEDGGGKVTLMRVI